MTTSSTAPDCDRYRLDDDEGLHLWRLTPLEALARHRELFGYDLIHALQAVVRRVLGCSPPDTCKLVLVPSAAEATCYAAAEVVTRENDVSKEDDKDGTFVATAESSQTPVSATRPHYETLIAESPAAVEFLRERGFVQYEIEDEISLHLPMIPPLGSRDRDAFVAEWAQALSWLRWASECNTSLLSIQLGKLLLLHPLTGEYRIRLGLKWTDEIGSEHEEEIFTTYRSAETHVPLTHGSLSSALRSHNPHSLFETDRSSASDSYDGSEDGLHASSSQDASPERWDRPQQTTALPIPSAAAGSVSREEKGPTSTTVAATASESDTRFGSGVSAAFQSLVQRLRGAAAAPRVPSVVDDSTTGEAEEAPRRIASSRSLSSLPPNRSTDAARSSIAMYRYHDRFDVLSTRCDRACDIFVEVLRKRPVIRDKVEAIGYFHYRNFLVQRVEVDLRNPDNSGGLPIGRMVLVLSSLSHKCFAVEAKKREERRCMVTHRDHHDLRERERKMRLLRRLNSDEVDHQPSNSASVLYGCPSPGSQTENVDAEWQVDGVRARGEASPMRSGNCGHEGDARNGDASLRSTKDETSAECFGPPASALQEQQQVNAGDEAHPSEPTASDAKTMPSAVLPPLSSGRPEWAVPLRPPRMPLFEDDPATSTQYDADDYFFA